MKDDFYIGYLPTTTHAARRSIRLALTALVGICLIVAGTLVLAQGPFPDSSFEYGQYRDYQGELIEWPYPMLLGATPSNPDARYLLVGPGKFGVANLLRGHDGQRVRLRGSRIARGQDQMLEIEIESLRFSSATSQSPTQPVDLGAVMFTGEIVDTKCHLGVMNPGNGKVHLGCAVRCISGGAPPGFLVRDDSGETRLLLLTGADGRALGREVLEFVAEPVTIRGQLLKLGTSLILKAEPRDFRRE
jgi:hypothetical protein